MDDTDDPYSILGIDSSATEAEIKSAYRKAALRHHPDKQRNESEHEQRVATERFAKISHAYELLTDPEQKKEFNLRQQQQNDAFYSHHRRPYHFHDPFQVFEQVFREEFGRPTTARMRSHRDPFFDDIDMMSDPFFNHSSPFSLFDSFLGVPSSRRRDDSRNFHQDPFSDMRRRHEQMMRQMVQGDGDTFGGESVTTRTTTKIVNGKRQSVTERVVKKADGTVERTVQRSGDDDFPTGALEHDLNFPALPGSRRRDPYYEEPMVDEQPELNSSQQQEKKRRGWFR